VFSHRRMLHSHAALSSIARMLSVPVDTSDRWGDAKHSRLSPVILGFLMRLVHPASLLVLPEVGLAAATLRRVSMEAYSGPLRGVGLDAAGSHNGCML
jgi:hypothetical protein